MDLYNSYVKDFEQCMSQLREIIDHPTQQKSITKENPYEFSQAQNYLKQMEIEQMNILEMDDNSAEAKTAKTSFQRHKKAYEKIRKDLRKA